MRYLFSLVFILALTLSVFSQEKLDSLLVLYARVVTADSALPIQNAHVISKFNHWGTISDDNGEFKMLVSPGDSVMVSSIGFSRSIFSVDSNLVLNKDPYIILMGKDTVMINEIIIHAFWDYRTFKHLIVNMEPLNLDNFYPNWEGTELLYQDIHPLAIKGPIQALYDVFSQSARLSRQLIKNRKEYNKLMIQMGRENDTIAPYPDHIMNRW
jgi:hypothetical protein